MKKWTFLTSLFQIFLVTSFHMNLQYAMTKDPPWFNKKITALIQEKNTAFKNCRNNTSNIDLKCRLKYCQACLNASIAIAKEKYYHETVNKLMNTQKNSKVYESLLIFS